MRTSKTGIAVVCYVLLTIGLLLSPASAYSFETDIRVAPNVLNLQSEGTVVTVHTDIRFSAVEGSTVSLNGVEISSWKADNRGNFVAKFLMDEVKDLEELDIGEYNTLTITGYTYDGEYFVGVQDIIVIDVAARGQ
jgi:hypothetical protein